MKKSNAFVCLIFILFSFQKPEKESIAKIALGERIIYNVSYGFLNAGEVIVTVDSSLVEMNGNICYKATVNARTKGVAGLFTTINDVWISYIDTTTLLSVQFDRRQQENNYHLLEKTAFDRTTQEAFVTRLKDKNAFELKTFKTPAHVQDMVSAYFNLRTNQGEKLNANDALTFDVFLEDTTFHLQMKYLEKDRIRTQLGKLKAYKFSPVIPKTNNSILTDENAILIWISADERRIPLKIKVNTKYGDVDVEIDEYFKGY